MYNENTVKHLLKQIKTHETVLSTVFGILILLFAGFLTLSYAQTMKKQAADLYSMYKETAESLTPKLFEELPTKADSSLLPAQYKVKKTDSTWNIAKAFYGDGKKYTLIEQENNLKKDQQLVEGMILTIPKLIEVAQ